MKGVLSLVFQDYCNCVTSRILIEELISEKSIIAFEEAEKKFSAVLVRDIANGNVKTVRPDSKLRQVLHKMVKFDISSVILMELDRPVGNF